MKKIVCFTVATVICFLLSSQTSRLYAQMNKNMVANRSIYKGIEIGDTAMLKAIAIDAIDHSGPMGELRGGTAIKTMLADFHNHIKNLKMTVVADAANGDYVFSWIRMTGTANDATMGWPAGAKINSTSVDILKFKNGKATEHWGYADPNEMMEMMKNMPMDNNMKMKKDSMR